ncbi:MAG: HAMP domain-containing histidine kinase [Muribaculaceae bacterium]|nr:HAMP domain-containing histidine kinase [Muribaculaceae bacterium]
MDSRRRINFHWQLFIPLATVLCLVFGAILWYQYKREADYRAEIITSQLDLINRRVINTYENDQDLKPFIAFVTSYYADSQFDGVRISVYADDGMLKYTLGVPLPFTPDPEKIVKTIDTGADSPRYVQRSRDGELYLLSSTLSPDGKVKVVTGIPYNSDVDDAINIDATVWYVIGTCMLVTLLVTFYFTRMLSRNVRLLKDFAYRAVSGGKFTGLDKFPRNELGDISREIITLYRERVTAIELIKKERKAAVHAFEEKARVTRQMTNNINHEIKTPVGIIRGYLESILGDPDMDAATRTRFLERMLSNVERLSNLLNDISTMTRLENGGDKIAVTKVDMYDLVFQIDYDMDANHLAGSLEFVYDIPLDCYVSGNPGLIQGMICGLIRNAAMYSGGTRIGLKLISENERFYVFTFYDDGNGVAEEHIPHLFERFYRVDTGRSRKQGGTGLGLPIVKSTIATHGGTISVHNRTTGGLEFIFSLPKWNPSDE